MTKVKLPGYRSANGTFTAMATRVLAPFFSLLPNSEQLQIRGIMRNADRGIAEIWPHLSPISTCSRSSSQKLYPTFTTSFFRFIESGEYFIWGLGANSEDSYDCLNHTPLLTTLHFHRITSDKVIARLIPQNPHILSIIEFIYFLIVLSGIETT